MDKESFIMGVYVGQRLGRWRNYNIVRWLNGDGSVLDEKTYKLGESEPKTYKIPIKESELATNFAFYKWGSPVKERNVTTYSPIFVEYEENEFLLTAKTRIQFYIITNGKVIIDWGDGSTLSISRNGNSEPKHEYSDVDTEYLVKITGRIHALHFATNVYPYFSNGLVSIITPFPSTFQSNPFGTSHYHYRRCFMDCRLLTYVPEDLFFKCLPSKEISHERDFSRCFEGCHSLISVPEKLFSRCTNTRDFSYCFYRCLSLESVGFELFKNCEEAYNFSYCFDSCENIITRVPDLWITHSSAIKERCYFKCTKAANYAAIPKEWKTPKEWM